MKLTALIIALGVGTSTLLGQTTPSQTQRYQALNQKVEALQENLSQWTENLNTFLESDSLTDSAYYQLEKQTSELNLTIREITKEAQALARQKVDKNKIDPTVDKAKDVLAEGMEVLSESMHDLGKSLNKLSQKLNAENQTNINEQKKQKK